MGLSDRDWYREERPEEWDDLLGDSAYARPRRHRKSVRLTALALLLVFVALIAFDVVNSLHG